jgi:hypothetical protein
MKKLATAIATIAIATSPLIAAPKAATPKSNAAPTAEQVTPDANGKCHWKAGTGHSGFVACPPGLAKPGSALKAHKDKGGKCQYDAGQSKKGFAPAALCK